MRITVSNWRAFDYVFIVVYPAEREAELIPGARSVERPVLGCPTCPGYRQPGDPRSQTLTGNDLFFAMFNKVTSLVNLQNPDYGPAAAAYDEANAYYNTTLVPIR